MLKQNNYIWKLYNLCASFCFQNCSATNSTMMICQSASMLPVNFKTLRQMKRSVKRLSTEIGFIMDSVKSVQNISGYFPDVNNKIQYYDDPVVFNFTEENQVKIFKGEVLTLKVSCSGLTTSMLTSL